MLLPEKYESIFDVSSEGPSSESLVNKDTKLPDEGPSLETSKILSYFSGRSIPNLLRRYVSNLYSFLFIFLFYRMVLLLLRTSGVGYFLWFIMLLFW